MKRTLREQFLQTLNPTSSVDLLMKDNNASYIKWLEEKVSNIIDPNPKSCALYVDYRQSCEALKQHRINIKG